jgi:enoyl-CoA hydratase/carnithine racemase
MEPAFSPEDAMEDRILRRDDRDGVATLTLNRPSQWNALSSPLLEELQGALDRIAPDPAVRVVVVAGNGRGFCSGHDLKEIRGLASEREVEALFRQCSRMMMTLAEIPQPVIARVHGLATAAGCQLVATCDLAVASTEARFATPGVNTGAFCATPSVALGRNVSRKHAMEMLLTGETIDATRAREIGLVNRVVAPDALDAEVGALAARIASRSPLAVATGKRMFYRQLDLGLADAYSLASGIIAHDFVGPDGREGLDAFVQKRAPVWRGR